MKKYILPGLLGVTEFWYGVCVGLILLSLSNVVVNVITKKSHSELKVEINRNESPSLKQHPDYYIGYAEGYVDGIDYQKNNKENK